MRKRSLACACLAVTLLMTGCKPGVPRKYIQPGKMEDILYDYHVAQGISQTEEGNAQSRDFNQNMYLDAVFKKHGVTRADFDSSMVYYCRHTEQLRDIYLQLSNRLSNGAMALGASAGEMGKYQVISNTGDTANIWRGERVAVLVPLAPYNKLSFSMSADTTFRAGDKLMLNFETQFLYQDGVKDGIAMLAMKFRNDSVANRVIHLSSSTSYSLMLSDEKHLGIKEVRGFIYLANGDANSTTLKLMFVDHLQLIRMHEKETPADNNNQQQDEPDKKDSLPPSVGGQRPDSLQPVRRGDLPR